MATKKAKKTTKTKKAKKAESLVDELFKKFPPRTEPWEFDDPRRNAAFDVFDKAHDAENIIAEWKRQTAAAITGDDIQADYDRMSALELIKALETLNRVMRA